ncbi:Winged helix DNA-binding domain-containing protein [Actinopolyspora lacussalsi subsp. righensis]|uniref:Winged helix DNA-binding domain-containing protein n=1 Tax=Actinopolyspora righensis TaxID=995060 RepID=A0A1I7CFI4_9ACTN|nr:transcriptional regulator [Actinopolyspora righensis]SFT98174.1 Winged helix DNA-binding domain-containing protein [Actinopolyspora righensis]
MSTARDPREALPTILHSPVRLAILGALRHVQAADFGDLQRGLEITTAELSRQLGVLHREELIEIKKVQRHRHTITRARLSEQGRSRFEEYLAELHRVAFGP